MIIVQTKLNETFVLKSPNELDFQMGTSVF